jgi:hypothetical protein
MLRGLQRGDKQGGRRKKQPPLVPKKEVTDSPRRLFAENKNARLAREANFLHLPVLADQ